MIKGNKLQKLFQKKWGQITQLYPIQVVEREEPNEEMGPQPCEKGRCYPTYSQVTTVDSLNLLLERYKDLFKEPNSLTLYYPKDLWAMLFPSNLKLPQ